MKKASEVGLGRNRSRPWWLLCLPAFAVQCGGSGSIGGFLDPDHMTIQAGRGHDLDVSINDGRVDLVVTGNLPEGVTILTEDGLGTRQVDLEVETEASAVPGNYRIKFFTYVKSDGYQRSGEDSLELTITPP